MSAGALVIRVQSAMASTITSEPKAVHAWTLRAVVICFLSLLIWSCIAQLDVVSVANGRLVPESYVKIVQPTDSGVLREILVH